MHKLRILSVGAVMVLALSACTAASTSSSSSSKSQSASSSRASGAASSSYTASATPTPKEQIDAKELIEHPEKAREYNFFTDVKFPITCPAHEVGKNPDKVPFESHNAPGGSAALTDDNKAGKEPRRRETEPHDWGLDNVDLKDDGSYSYSTKGGKETAEVAADGTWKSKNSDGDTTTLNADGSWDSYTEKTETNMHVNPNGTWVKKTGESAKIQMFADGSWCYEYKDSEITYGTPDGKIYEGVSDKKWREVAQKTWENRSSDKSIKDPETPLAPLTVKDGVIPLRARNPIAAGQKAFP